MIIRHVKPADIPAWSRMRTQLWPDTSDAHLAEIHAFFTGTSADIVQVLVLQLSQDEKFLAGFIELNIRSFAEGSRQPRVPYIEAWFIDVAYRKQGYGKLMIDAAEAWARKQGFSELASDTEIYNHNSIALHKKFGFKEIDRVVCFLKKLD